MKDDGWNNAASDTYAHRAYTTGRRKMPPPNVVPPIPPIPPGGLPAHVRKVSTRSSSFAELVDEMSQLLILLFIQQPHHQHQHPGKINLSEFTNVTDAIARMILGGGKDSGNGPPPPPPPRLAKVSFHLYELRAVQYFRAVFNSFSRLTKIDI